MADTPLYRKNFRKNFRPFIYKPGDIISLERTVYYALSDANLSEHLIRGAIFASEFTWTNRTIKMLAKY